jgi:hypothetical protein
MNARHVAVVLILAAAVLGACDSSSTVTLATAAGLSVPSADELAKKLEGSLRESTTKTYVKRDGRLVEVRPSRATQPLSAVVRSFDPKTGLAYVDLLAFPEYNMPLLQIWRFDGKAWSDSVDAGIFTR